MTISNILVQASNKIAHSVQLNGSTAKFEAQLILQHTLKVNRAWLIAHESNTLSTSAYAAFDALLNRRLNGEPIAYILGYQEFFGLQLKVSADTLIPRPDTETLVEAALAKIPPMAQPFDKPMTHYERNLQADNKQDLLVPVCPALAKGCRSNNIRVLDLGTGSGAIALAIAKHRPYAQVTAVDASESALAIAFENAQHLNIENVHFELSDWFSALNNQLFDVILSNPPYIEADDIHLKQGDLRFEPLSALASGADGYDDIRRIINNSPQYLNKKGWLMLEHGYNQAEYVANLMRKDGFSQISHVKDLAGIMRVTVGRYVDD